MSCCYKIYLNWRKYFTQAHCKVQGIYLCAHHFKNLKENVESHYALMMNNTFKINSATECCNTDLVQ